MYGDATGESLWKIRGQGFMNNIGAVEWKLQRGDGMRRTIEIDNKTTELSLTDDGFQKR
jgi:ABC-type tungstate transport system permease subunit